MTPDAAKDVVIVIPWVAVISIVAGALGIFSAVFGYFFRKAISTREQLYNLRFSTLDKSVVELGERVGQVFPAHDKLRDRWEEFLREYLTVDSTRGQKIDALFRVVDQMQETLRELKPALNVKVEDAFCRAVNELKVYVRDQIREEKHAA